MENGKWMIENGKCEMAKGQRGKGIEERAKSIAHSLTVTLSHNLITYYLIAPISDKLSHITFRKLRSRGTFI